MTESTGRSPDPSGQYVQSLARGLAVIRSFDADHPEMTLSDIARRTELTRATSRRFLLTLLELGYVKTDGRMFSLTARVLELGFSYLSALTLPEIAQPHLEQLAASIHESTSASVLDGPDIVYVARVPTRRIMSVRINIGTRFPAYATSMGRVLLSSLTPDDLARQLDGIDFEGLTSHTIRTRDALVAELDRVREQGWAMVDQELENGLRSIAAPIFHGRETIAAINVSTTANSHTIESIEENLLPQLRLAAERISEDLTASRPFSKPSSHGLSPTSHPL
ncbi:IclR family transcriptional regulator C-terminal domain-containing protein [Leifsonia bigeumensis]|uniref:IclR family transcriptional regulator C-terminal domain-containing protein n=1 Tax=Leifsonella bigeumensis TaxID=433643 RepID=A0ABP7G1N1_9MICO|nr:IclR family transcriptional regulator C-terminal domain-containing protein [Terrimesophilobacter sp.]